MDVVLVEQAFDLLADQERVRRVGARAARRAYRRRTRRSRAAQVVPSVRLAHADHGGEVSLRYAGLRADGTPVTGRARNKPLSVWVQQRYRAGWGWLRVERDGASVAGIRRADDGTRTWWADAVGAPLHEGKTFAARLLAAYAACERQEGGTR